MFLIDPRRPAETGKESTRRPNGWRAILPPLAGLAICMGLTVVAVLAVTYPYAGACLLGALLTLIVLALLRHLQK